MTVNDTILPKKYLTVRGCSHNATCLQQVNVYNGSTSLMHICPVSHADFYVDGSDNRTQELTPGGLRRLIYWLLFRRKWLLYTSDYNIRWTTQLEPTSKASLRSLLLSLKTEREGEELRVRVFWGIPLTSPVLFQSYQCLPLLSEFWMECNWFSIVLVS